MHFLFPNIVFLIIFVHGPSISVCADNEKYHNCGKLIECGNIRDIGYPFWGLGNTRPDYCGPPNFQLSCINHVLHITISSQDYRVLDIDVVKHELRLVRKDYWNNVCPHTELHNTTLDDMFSFFNYTLDTEYMTLLYDCKVKIGMLNYFNCSTSGRDTVNYFLTELITQNNLRKATAVHTSFYGNCKESVVVRVFQSEAMVLQNDTSSLKDKVIKAVSSGFGLKWDANNTLCDACEGTNGRCGYNPVSGEFVCYQNQDVRSSLRLSWAIGISVAVLGFFTISVVIFCIHKRKYVSSKVMVFWNKDKTEEFDVEAFIRNHISFAPKRYSYSQVKKMTNSFANSIGRGGYGCVYKGTLPDGHLVAVKVLKESKSDGEEFINEVASMGRTSHVNIVTLFGFCYEGTKRALIYDYMPNGSLDKFIFNQEFKNMPRSCLEWKTLYEIALGIARGLEYLHRGCNTRILHFDIKPQNILLDEDFCPKISDFGLAKLWLNEESIVSVIGTRGTVGYIAPEVFSRNFGGVSHKSDVYSYGMLVLELVGGRKNINARVHYTSEIYFPSCIYEDLELGRDLRVSGVATEEEKEIARKMVMVSFWCIQTNPSERPQMSKVVDMLEGDLQSIQIPPKPFLFSPPRSPQQYSTKS
ncbi:LEAF RUST 10 DISEASE-RESISTANCE LOCUS RECEPTOR-LIKE PROTEIN KINASE-like 2.4 [Ziziphus jujuba]|uniref:non-specific serine/threonine protein kinase n=1 Tax=Ziziphus jujuba TaxID=326968 RepID=A0A6P4AHX9_ZIZJJ|nr:LEAF RUST 10 DISEASE-RESISTANCE LOCUS RECEPTOR-LIKE PROTEIN KINASE-like 2.4 [Ziziphus jujuba]